MGIPASSRAPVDISNPQAFGICDRCGFRYVRSSLQFQYDWRGNNLQNLWLLVCEVCYDVPNDQFRPIIIGPDPVPVKDPRPGFYATQMGPTPVFSVEDLLGDSPGQGGLVDPLPTAGRK